LLKEREGKYMNTKSLLPALGISALIVLLALQVVAPPSKAVSVDATFDIKPETLNLNMKGRWLTGFITLTSNGYNVSDINASKPVLLDDLFRAVSSNIEDNVLVVKFDYTVELRDHIWMKLNHMGKRTSMELEVTGELNDGTAFKGIDTITVINPPFGN
jgi:hypothetical protein